MNEQPKRFKKSNGGTKPSIIWSHFIIEGYRDEKSHRRNVSCRHCKQKFASARLAELKKHILKKCEIITEESRESVNKEITLDSRHHAVPVNAMDLSSIPHNYLHLSAYPDQTSIPPMHHVDPNILQASFVGESSLDVNSSPYSQTGKRKLPFVETVEDRQRSSILQHMLANNMQSVPSHPLGHPLVGHEQQPMVAIDPDYVAYLVCQWFLAASIPFQTIDHQYAIELFHSLRCPCPSSARLSQIYQVLHREFPQNLPQASYMSQPYTSSSSSISKPDTVISRHQTSDTPSDSESNSDDDDD
jgi:hypothetical protein